MSNTINPETLAAFQANGWIPGAGGAAVAPAPPPPSIAAAPAPTPQQPAYRPIGAPVNALPSQGYGPSQTPNATTQAQADAALQASLTDGGPVKGKGDAAGSGAALLPPAASGPATAAGMRPSTASTEVKSGVPVTPALQDSQEALRSANDDVNRRQGDVAALQPIEAKARAQEEAIHETHMIAADQQRQTDYASELANEKWKRDKAHAAYDLAVSKGVDPGRYLHDKSVGGLFATALSVMAGGFVSGFRGGPNQAMDMVNKAIDHDVASQRDNIENKKGQADAADSHLNLFMKEGMDRNQAAAASAVLIRQQFAKQLDAKYTETSNAMGKLSLAQAAQKNAQEMAKSEQEYGKLTANQVTQKVDEKWHAASGGGTGAPTRKQVSDLAADLVKDGKYSNPDDAMRAAGHLLGFDPKGAAPVPAAAGKAGSDKVSPRLGVRLSSVQNAVAALDDVEKLTKGGPMAALGAITPSGQIEGKGAAGRARSALLQAGVPTEEVDRVLPKDWNPPRHDVTNATKARVDEARQLLEQQRKTIQGAVDMSKGGGVTPEPDEKD